MRVFTPAEVAAETGSKYLGILVAATFSREMNALPKEAVPVTQQKKLTTRALEALVNNELEYELTKRRRKGVQQT